MAEDVSWQSLQQQIGQVRRRIGRLLEMYEEGYLEKREFSRGIETARLRLSRLEGEARAEAERIEDVNELKLLIPHRATLLPLFPKVAVVIVGREPNDRVDVVGQDDEADAPTILQGQWGISAPRG